jgi:regulator of RNase E activity RraA
MLERHMLYGVVNELVHRPDPALVEQFRRHDTAKVGDAMAAYGIMDHRIKPIRLGMRLLGPAVTVLTRPGDALFIQKAADVAQAGDVIVVDAGGFEEGAVIGERIAYYMHSRGIRGIVVDGAVRDTAGIAEIGFPSFAKAVTPRIFGTVGPGAINVPIQCGGVPVNPGDLILGDDDGVVVVPCADVARVLDLADKHLAGELQRLERVKNGEKLSVINNCDEKIARWRATDQ